MSGTTPSVTHQLKPIFPTLQSRGVTVEFTAVTFDETVNPDTPVTIPDPNLRAKIEAALGKASGATITEWDMATLTGLDAGGSNISDLTGLEGATNLDNAVSCNKNNISDLSPCWRRLTKLTRLISLSKQHQ